MVSNIPKSIVILSKGFRLPCVPWRWVQLPHNVSWVISFYILKIPDRINHTEKRLIR